MKHLATIQSEFLKIARKWDDLSYEEQKGYLSRHPGSKRKLTAKPGKSTQTSDTKKKKDQKKKEPDKDIKSKIQQKKKEVTETKTDDTSSKITFDDIAKKLQKRSPDEIKADIETMQTKINKREQSAARREQRAHGDLDGTSFEAAYEKSKPDMIRIKLYNHFLQNGNKKLPKDLQEELDDLNNHLERVSTRKERIKKQKEEHSDLVGKIITWKSNKLFGKEMTGRVISISSGRRGPMVKTDTGWRLSPGLITSVKDVPKNEQNKVRIKPKDLIGKEIRWKTKKRPSIVNRSVSGHPGASIRYEQTIPGYDAATSTAGGIVTEAKGQKLVVEGWRIPMSLIQQVDGKSFDGWTKSDE